MTLSNLISRPIPAKAWSGSGKIPWNDPAFSRRMLQNHLSQEHDWASRRKEIITRQVQYIAGLLPPEATILDLGCGPGLYTAELAKMGFRCTGVDFSPASVDYARDYAAEHKLNAKYLLEDIRDHAPSKTYDAVLLLFGEINVFKREDAAKILSTAAKALRSGGHLVLEGHSFSEVEKQGKAPATWYSTTTGLFSGQPHICLQENFWDEATATATTRYLIAEAEKDNWAEYYSSMSAYSPQDYRRLFQTCGLNECALLNPEQWPVGEDFAEKLQGWQCRKA